MLPTRSKVGAGGHSGVTSFRAGEAIEMVTRSSGDSGLLEAAPDAIEGLIGLVNAQAERLFGYDRHELLGSADRDVGTRLPGTRRPWMRVVHVRLPVARMHDLTHHRGVRRRQPLPHVALRRTGDAAGITGIRCTRHHHPTPGSAQIRAAQTADRRVAAHPDRHPVRPTPFPAPVKPEGEAGPGPGCFASAPTGSPGSG